VLGFVLVVFLIEQARPAVRRRLLARGHLADMCYLLAYALAVVPLIVATLGPLFLVQAISAMVIAVVVLATRHILAVAAGQALANRRRHTSYRGGYERHRGVAGEYRMMVPFRSLSARRRVFFAGLALLAAAAAIAVAVTAIGYRAGHQPRAGFPAQNRPGPVLLVPGYGGSTSALSVLAGRIRATGRPAMVVRLPGSGTGSLALDASVLGDAVARALRGGASSVDVIGYSAGGVAALLWAREDDGGAEARRVVTLGSPFHGTGLATTAAGLAPGACPAACQQLVPGSSLLAGVAAGVPSRLHWLSLWTTDDQTVTPPDSARLAGAVNVPIQSVCPQQRISHSQLPTNRAVTAMVLAAIGRGPLTVPAPADCRA
jgi:triacylglycerol lipase